MNSYLSHISFYFESIINDFFIDIIGIIGIFKFWGILQGSCEFCSRFFRYHFGKQVHFRVVNPHDSSDIFYRSSSCKSTKSTDLGYFISSVFVSTIGNNSVTFSVCKIGIDIWHGNTRWVEKSLKNQSVWKWIYIGNSRSKGHKWSSCWSSSWSYWYILSSCPVDIVSYN